MASRYAVVKTGGKQYRVAEGETLEVELLEGEPGATVDLGQVLMVVDGEQVTLGKPTVEGATVTAQIVDETRGPKLIIFKYRRRKRYRRKTGHRQTYTKVKVTGIHV